MIEVMAQAICSCKQYGGTVATAECIHKATTSLLTITFIMVIPTYASILPNSIEPFTELKFCKCPVVGINIGNEIFSF